jgi:hypothetical protein
MNTDAGRHRRQQGGTTFFRVGIEFYVASAARQRSGQLLDWGGGIAGTFKMSAAEAAIFLKKAIATGLLAGIFAAPFPWIGDGQHYPRSR